jgi:hypothetical protein
VQSVAGPQLVAALHPLGEPWRLDKRPYGQAVLSTAAACPKGFYLQMASLRVNADLGLALNISRVPTRTVAQADPPAILKARAG